MITKTPVGYSRRGSFVLDPVYLHIEVQETSNEYPVFIQTHVKGNNQVADGVWTFNPASPKLLLGLHIYKTRQMLREKNLMDTEMQYNRTEKKKSSIFKPSSYLSLWSERSKSSLSSSKEEDDHKGKISFHSKWNPFSKSNTSLVDILVEKEDEKEAAGIFGSSSVL